MPAELAKVELRGRRKVDAAFTFTVIAHNLIRLPKTHCRATRLTHRGPKIRRARPFEPRICRSSAHGPRPNATIQMLARHQKNARPNDQVRSPPSSSAHR